MKKLIKRFEERIEQLEISLNAWADADARPHIKITESGWNRIYRQESKLIWNEKELSRLKKMPSCTCSWFYKLFRKYEIVEDYGDARVCKCKKCNRHYVKRFMLV